MVCELGVHRESVERFLEESPEFLDTMLHRPWAKRWVDTQLQNISDFRSRNGKTLSAPWLQIRRRVISESRHFCGRLPVCRTESQR